MPRMTTQRRPVPDALLRAAADWNKDGQRPQLSAKWSMASWQRWLPEHSGELSALPNPIGRTAVLDVCRSAASSREEAVRGFIAAMVWGHGSVGYGAFRTARVLRENDGAADRLLEVATRARDEGGPAAFEWLAKNRLHWLGVAFATKYLFFCAAAGAGRPALVLDRLVRDWLVRNAGWSLSLDWRVADYRSYVDTVCGWADELGIEAGDAEMLMFRLAASRGSGQWSEPATLADPESQDPVSASADEDGHGVLDALDEAAAAFAEFAGTTATEDADDFERGLRHLRRIVIARQRLG